MWSVTRLYESVEGPFPDCRLQTSHLVTIRDESGGSELVGRKVPLREGWYVGRDP